MDQLEFFDIHTPCQRVCETDKQGYCIRCYRSREERYRWLTFSDAEKQEVLRLCKQRALRRRRYLLAQQQSSTLGESTSQIEFNF